MLHKLKNINNQKDFKCNFSDFQLLALVVYVSKHSLYVIWTEKCQFIYLQHDVFRVIQWTSVTNNLAFLIPDNKVNTDSKYCSLPPIL